MGAGAVGCAGIIMFSAPGEVPWTSASSHASVLAAMTTNVINRMDSSPIEQSTQRCGGVPRLC
jgi:hypothetical protein